MVRHSFTDCAGAGGNIPPYVHTYTLTPLFLLIDLLNMLQSKHMEAVHAALLLSHYHLLADLPSPATAAGGVGGGAMLEALVLGYIKEFKSTDPQVGRCYKCLRRGPKQTRDDAVLCVGREWKGSEPAFHILFMTPLYFSHTNQTTRHPTTV